ncbi:hypothetical protein VARIO8X_60166 [Burkholderiales bacterium 8X]|nr:hypothetical protein VARIO8X_60166 [Burkholderiales bacterium 8X]
MDSKYSGTFRARRDRRTEADDAQRKAPYTCLHIRKKRVGYCADLTKNSMILEPLQDGIAIVFYYAEGQVAYVFQEHKKFFAEEVNNRTLTGGSRRLLNIVTSEEFEETASLHVFFDASSGGGNAKSAEARANKFAKAYASFQQAHYDEFYRALPSAPSEVTGYIEGEESLVVDLGGVRLMTRDGVARHLSKNPNCQEKDEDNESLNVEHFHMLGIY